MRKIDKIILHCTATPPGKDLRRQELLQMHRERGFTDIGYHIIIRRDGTLMRGRPLDQVGAHCRGYNRNSIGIAYVGGLDQEGRPADTRTEAQHWAMLQLIEAFTLMYPDIMIYGHNELNPHKDCPCFRVATDKHTGIFLEMLRATLNL